MNALKHIISLTLILLIICGQPAGAEETDGDFRKYVRDLSSFTFRGLEDAEPAADSELSPHQDPFYLHDHDMLLGESYGDFSSGGMALRFGRQQYHSGIGYAWKPTDLFNPKPFLDPMYGLEGIDSAYMAYSFPGDGEYEISTFYSFENNHEGSDDPNVRDGDYHVKVKTHMEVLDLAIHYTEVNRNRTDYEGLISGNVEPENAVIPVRWHLLSAGISSQIGGMGIYAEGGHAWLSVDEDTDKSVEENFAKDHSKFLVGVDYTFENELYLVLEYYQEGQGKASSEDYTLNDRLGYFSNERDAIGRDNVFVGARYPIADMTSIELYNIINANDSSMILNPWLVWSAGEDITVKFSAQIPVGEEDSSVGGAEPSAFAHIQLNF